MKRKYMYWFSDWYRAFDRAFELAKYSGFKHLIIKDRGYAWKVYRTDQYWRTDETQV